MSSTLSNFDAIIVGTGLCESVLAASLALQGSSVLHIDQNPFYGASWATLNISQLEKLQQQQNSDEPPQIHSSQATTDQIEQVYGKPDDVEVIPLPFCSTAENLFPLGFRIIEPRQGANENVNKKKVLIDLTPRPVMASSKLIDMLTRTNAGHYIDFRPIEAQYQQFGDTFQKVPASRSDIFQTQFITPIEKRLLTRFIKSCMEEDDQVDESAADVDDSANTNADETFKEVMTKMKLTDKLQSFIHTSIAFTSSAPLSTVSAREGRRRIQQYANSLLRFGTKTPFLYPNHGTGELPQALCRLCAVRGGTYILRRGAAGLIVENDTNDEDKRQERRACGVVTVDGDVVKAPHVFLGPNLLPNQISKSEDRSVVWRFAGVVDGSIRCDNNEQEGKRRLMVNLAVRDKDSNQVEIRVRQIDSSTFVCAEGQFIVYAECVHGSGGEDALLSGVRRVIEIEDNENGANIVLIDEKDDDGGKSKPKLLWGMVYAREGRKSSDNHGIGCRVKTLSPSEAEIGVEAVIDEAEAMFRSVFPDGEFFPDITEDMRKMISPYDENQEQSSEGE